MNKGVITMMTMDDRDGKIWMDGQWVEWRDAKVHVLTHTLHYGAGVFEGLRAYHTDKGAAIFKLEERKSLFLKKKSIKPIVMPLIKII